MTLKEIKEVIQLMNENGLSEIEIEKDGLKIRMHLWDCFPQVAPVCTESFRLFSTVTKHQQN